MMTTAEIRADMVNELRAAADGYQSLGVRNMQLAGMCRSLAAQHRAQASQIESTLNQQPSTIFSQPPTVTGLAGENNAEPVTFKIKPAASPSAAIFKEAA